MFQEGKNRAVRPRKKRKKKHEGETDVSRAAKRIKKKGGVSGKRTKNRAYRDRNLQQLVISAKRGT